MVVFVDIRPIVKCTFHRIESSCWTKYMKTSSFESMGFELDWIFGRIISWKNTHSCNDYSTILIHHDLSLYQSEFAQPIAFRRKKRNKKNGCYCATTKEAPWF